MAKKKTRARGSRFADDAALQAIVRYEPEESGLKALAQQARADYGVSVRQAQTTGDLTLQAAREAIPSVANIYDRAGLDQAKTASLVSPELAALSGPGAATLQRGGALEVAQQLGNLRAAKAAALEDLNTRAVAARQGQQYGILNARQKFSADMAKILGQSQSLAAAEGRVHGFDDQLVAAVVAGAALSRNNARATRPLGRTQRGADAVGAQQPALERHRPGHGEADPGRQARPEGAGQEAEVADAGAARRGEGSGVVDPVVDPSEQGGLRVAARDGERSGDRACRLRRSRSTARASRSRQKVRDPGVPKAPSQLAASIALDLEFDGHVSRRNIAELHKRRLSLNQLGFKGAAGTKPRRPEAEACACARRRRGTSGAIPGLGNISFGR
jgi:hypothetical protein